MYLIINADDFGYNPNCTWAIAECFQRGWITNTTLMVTMPDCEMAVEMAKKGGFADRLGLHINIYGSSRPLTEEIRRFPIFCGEDGLFNHVFCEGFRRIWGKPGDDEKNALREEIVAQFDRFLSFDLPLRHFDSHHHSHMIMRVLPTICEVAKSRGFKTARRGINVASCSSIKSKVYYAVQDYFQCRTLRRHRLAYTRYMCDFANFRAHISDFGRDDTVELMVHPFYAKDGKLDDTGEMSDSGLRPMQEVVDFIAANRSRIELISFAGLSTSH